MNNKEKSLTGYLLGINVLHIIICCVVMMLRKYGIFDTSYMRYGALGVTLFAWFVFAFLTALGTRMSKIKYAFLYSFLSVVPIIIIVLFCFGLSMFEGLGWLKFFFIGSTVNFYFRPFVSLAAYIDMSAYLFYGACIVLIFIFAVLGCVVGINTDKKKDRSKKQRKQPKAEKPKKKVEDKPKKKAKPTKKKLEEMSEEAKLIEDEVSGKTLKAGSDSKTEVRKPAEKVLGENISAETDKELQEEIERLKKKLEERKKQNAAD